MLDPRVIESIRKYEAMLEIGINNVMDMKVNGIDYGPATDKDRMEFLREEFYKMVQEIEEATGEEIC